jgi:hypothetical protein
MTKQCLQEAGFFVLRGIPKALHSLPAKKTLSFSCKFFQNPGFGFQ